MNTALWLSVVFSFVPLCSVAAALLIPFKFSNLIISMIQSLASGFLIGGIFFELAPRILDSEIHYSLLIAFIIGFLMMHIMNAKGEDGCGDDKHQTTLTRYIFPYYIEFIITGILIGITAFTNVISLFVIALSFGLCNFICGLSIATRLSKSAIEPYQSYLLILSMLLIFPVFALLSALFIHVIPTTWLNELIAYAIAVLLYLVLNELYLDAIKVKKLLGLFIIFSTISVTFALYYLTQFL